jgi:hypothetical protein
MVEFSHHEYLKPFLLCTTKKMSNNQSVAHSCLLGKEIQHSHGMQHHIHGDDQWDLVEREAIPDGPTAFLNHTDAPFDFRKMVSLRNQE